MDHYYTEKPESEYIEKKLQIVLRDDNFSIFSASGVFSKDSLDMASKLLIQTALIPKSGKVLDLGCGYGIVGLSVLRKNKSLDLTFSDINERALALVEKNLSLLGLKGKIIKSDVFKSIKEHFDCILLNPPMAAGKDICFKMIEDSFNHLNKGGTLQIVARHNKGGKTLQEKMNKIFGETIIVSKKSGFKVYLANKH